MGNLATKPADYDIMIDGVHYKKVKRTAKVGELVLMLDYVHGKNGDVLRVRSVNHGVAQFVGKPNGQGSPQRARGRGDLYVVLEPLEPSGQSGPELAPTSTAQLTFALASLAAENVTLKKRLDSVEANVAGHERQIGESQLFNGSIERTVTRLETQLRVAREDIILVQEGVIELIESVEKRVAALESLAQTASKPVPTKLSAGPIKPAKRLTRADVIETAKRDVTKLENTYQSRAVGRTCFWPAACSNHGFFPVHHVEYVVDRDSRTVIAKIVCTESRRVENTGIASCAPDDVFNVHIGKAIALRRALELPVPDEYIHAPKPTSVGVGDIVTFKNGTPTTYRVDSLETIGRNCTILESTCGQSGRSAYGVDFSWARIVDDSRDSETAVSP